MKIRNPDTGEIVTLYPTEEYTDEIQAFFAAACRHEGGKELRIYTASNDAKHYRHQCLTCGEAVGQSFPKTSVDGTALHPFDEGLPKQYRTIRGKDKDAIVRKHITKQVSADVRFSRGYNEYLASDKWAAKRRKVLDRAGNICEGCRQAKATEVHHLTYEHLFDEFLFELVALCRPCHTRWHKEEDPEEEYYELPCCACRFQGEDDNGQPWCFVHEVPALVALSPEGECGPENKSLEPLK